MTKTKERIPFEKTKEPDAVEKLFCEKFKDTQKHPLSENHMRIMINFIMSDLSKNPEFDETLAGLVKSQTMTQIITKRMASLGYSIDDRTNVFLSYFIDSPGIAVMYVYYMAYWAKKNGKERVTFSDFCEHIFPFGFPSQDELSLIWDNQKIDRRKADSGGTDNLVDYFKASESIRNIKDEVQD